MADPSTALPAGKTCGDCHHLRRCRWLIGVRPTATACDWAPSRFAEAVKPLPRPRPGAYVSPLDPPPGDPRAAHQILPGTRTCAPTCPCKAAR
jgi:hypothetical protein